MNLSHPLKRRLRYPFGFILKISDEHSVAFIWGSLAPKVFYTLCTIVHLSTILRYNDVQYNPVQSTIRSNYIFLLSCLVVFSCCGTWRLFLVKYSSMAFVRHPSNDTIVSMWHDMLTGLFPSTISQCDRCTGWIGFMAGLQLVPASETAFP